jgi:hypothetical protein
MSGEIAKMLRTKLWALRLRSKDDVNKHVNDFTLYMDQLRELGREEREETLTDLFLDSIIDPKFEVTVANCRLRDHISIQECFEAVRKYDNVILREATQGNGGRYKTRRLKNSLKQALKHQGGQRKIRTSVAINRRKLQWEWKRTRRQAAAGEPEPQNDESDYQQEEDIL